MVSELPFFPRNRGDWEFPKQGNQKKGMQMSRGFESLDVVFEKDGHFHTLSLNTGHTSSNVDSALSALFGADYEVVSVIVNDEVGPTEILENIPTYTDLSEFFFEADTESNRVDQMVAFVLAFGWGEWNEDDYSDRFISQNANEEEFAEAYVTDYHNDGNGLNLPSYVEIDWEATAQNIVTEEGVTLQQHNGEVFAFRDC